MHVLVGLLCQFWINGRFQTCSRTWTRLTWSPSPGPVWPPMRLQHKAAIPHRVRRASISHCSKRRCLNVLLLASLSWCSHSLSLSLCTQLLVRTMLRLPTWCGELLEVYSMSPRVWWVQRWVGWPGWVAEAWRSPSQLWPRYPWWGWDLWRTECPPWPGASRQSARQWLQNCLSRPRKTRPSDKEDATGTDSPLTQTCNYM